MLMAAEEVINLFDSYWFERNILFHCIEKPFDSDKILSQNLLINANGSSHIHDHDTAKLQGRSLSDRYLRYESTSSYSNNSSPKSVITPKLKKIMSGKEICEFSDEDIIVKETKKKSTIKTIRRKGMSKSLSELEFQEVKGFMELGFVFTEEDKSSSLVSIIPGLQRFGQESDHVKGMERHDCSISRPYLSEAWEDLDHKKANRLLMKMKFSALPNEKDMKNHLKAWAQTVASTVR